jgi:hypothetical protein
MPTFRSAVLLPSSGLKNAVKGRCTYVGVSKSFRTESITKYTLTEINTR